MSKFKTVSRTAPTSLVKINKRIDPILIFLSVIIFGILFVVSYWMFSTLTIISIGIGSAVILYQLFTSRPLQEKYSYKKKLPSSFSLFVLITPVVFGVIMAFEGYSLWDSLTKAIIVWGLTMTFWSTMFFIPLAVYGKYREADLQNPTIFPTLSIIIPAYNEEKVIAHTIEALISEDYQKKEIIVVNDGSTDKTLEIAKSYQQEIKIINKQNGGKASALNCGLRYASGEIIVIVDADTIIGLGSLKELVKGFQSNKRVAAIAGNIKVRNRQNLLTWCQALEYIASIQITRRAFDYFGSIPIVPGALGAFSRSSIDESGLYDKSTIVEDFDTTVKVAKSGFVIQGSTKATAYTEAPATFSDFIKQRKRWYRGNLQVYLKHFNVLLNPRFGFLQRLSFPFMIFSALLMPFVGFAVIASVIITLIQGEVFFVLQIFLLFIILQYLQSLLALRIDGEGLKVALYSVFFVIGYKQLLDALLIKAIFEMAFKKKASWTSAKRIGL